MPRTDGSHINPLMPEIHLGRECDASWQDEVDRLTRAGTPTEDKVNRLHRVGWRIISTSP
jgi:hypothetical protein